MLVYLIVVPLLIFFMLKDRDVLMANFGKLLPSNRALITQVGQEMNLQIMNYIRGKVIEIIVVAIVSFVTFSLFGLQLLCYWPFSSAFRCSFRTLVQRWSQFLSF